MALSGLLFLSKGNRFGTLARGEPYLVGGRTLTPFARIRSFELAGGRMRMTRIEPIGMLEDAAGTRHWIPVAETPPAKPVRLFAMLFPVVLFVLVATITRPSKRPARQPAR